MFVLLQHPFCDLREFMDESCGRLPFPEWPNPYLDDFVRSSGQVKPRFRGGANWPGEYVYARAHNAFRFPDLLSKRPLAGSNVPARATHAQRRFFSDGLSARFEVALRITDSLDFERHYVPENGADFLAVLAGCLSIPVTVAIGQEKIRHKTLVGCGRALAKHFLFSSTERTDPNAQPPKPWWFSAEVPALFVELKCNVDALPPHSQLVFELPDNLGSLHHVWIQSDQHICSTWIVKWDGEEADQEFEKNLRLLRLHLVHLHTEHACLNRVIIAIKTGKLDVKHDRDIANKINDYLNKVTNVLGRPKRYGFDQKAILDAARYAIDTPYSGKTEALDLMRRQVQQKVERFIRESRSVPPPIIITGNGTVVQEIKDINIKAGGDSHFTVTTTRDVSGRLNINTEKSTETLTRLLDELSQGIEALSDQLDTHSKDTIRSNLQLLKDQALEAEPNKKTFNVSAERIIKAMKAVGEAGSKMILMITQIRGLLGL